MVTKNFIFSLKVILEGLSTAVACTVVLILVNGYKVLGIGNCAKLSISLLFIYVFLRFLASLHKIPKSVEECKEQFKDVADLPRNRVGILILCQILTLMVLFFVMCVPTFSYNAKYPHAESTIKKAYGINDTTVTLIKSLPSWYSERIYANSETLHACEEVMAKPDLTDKDRRSLINEMTNEFHEFSSRLKVRVYVSFVLLVLYGYFNTIIHRRNTYMSAMRSFKKKGKK